MTKICILLLVSFLTIVGCSRYEPEKPDAPANRKGFKAITRIEPGMDVKNVYFYADEFSGINPLYCMAFQASRKTVERIVEELNMTESNSVVTKEPLVNIPAKLKWWNAESRRKSKFYFVREEASKSEYFFWHDPVTGECQFMMFCF